LDTSPNDPIGECNIRATTLIVASSGTALAQDVEKGAVVFKKCAICHKIGPGATNSIGPELNGPREISCVLALLAGGMILLVLVVDEGFRPVDVFHGTIHLAGPGSFHPMFGHLATSRPVFNSPLLLACSLFVLAGHASQLTVGIKSAEVSSMSVYQIADSQNCAEPRTCNPKNTRPYGLCRNISLPFAHRLRATER
jgi:hypothetical protein